jgi:hypothetical protein
MERSRLVLLKKRKVGSPASQAAGTQSPAVGEEKEEPLFGTEL